MSKFIEPDETHVLKAAAWDALYAGLQAQDNRESIHMLDSLFEKVGAKLSNPMTWENGMAKKYESDERFYCRACRHAEPREDWKPIKLANAPFSICPYCGAIIDLSIANKIGPAPDETSIDLSLTDEEKKRKTREPATADAEAAIEAAKKKKAAVAKKRRAAAKKKAAAKK